MSLFCGKKCKCKKRCKAFFSWSTGWEKDCKDACKHDKDLDPQEWWDNIPDDARLLWNDGIPNECTLPDGSINYDEGLIQTYPHCAEFWEQDPAAQRQASWLPLLLIVTVVAAIGFVIWKMK